MTISSVMENLTSPTILVTGANGQLGKELQKLSVQYPSHRFLFSAKEDLPVENTERVQKLFERQRVNYCINCAAYTAVDKAETEREKAHLINAAAVADLAKVCNDHQTGFIHVSTDYVFDGRSSKPYKEDDAVAPLNVYGASKLKGEELAFKNNPSALIVRTSWVYSSFGNNFVKTMLRLLKEKQNISVVSDQYGCPTYAADLAAAIMKIVDHSAVAWIPGIVNYCNAGITSWYEFALAIKEFIESDCIIHPIASSEYKTLAARPHFSVLDTGKIRSLLGLYIPDWKDSLGKCLLTFA